MNASIDYGTKIYQDFGPVNQGAGQSIPVGGSQQFHHIALYGTPSARARIAAALEIVFKDQYAADLLQRFVRRIDCVQTPDRLSRQSQGYAYQAVDPRWPVQIIADFIFQGSFWNGGWGVQHAQQIQTELEKFRRRKSGFIYDGPSHQTKIEVPQQYKPAVDSGLDVVRQCMDFQEFQNRFLAIIYDPRQPIFLHTHNCPAFTHCKYGTRNRMYLSDYFFANGSPENWAFVFLHEWKHAQLWDARQRVGGLREENICDMFAHNTLKKAGFRHTYNSDYTPGLVA